VDACGHLQDVLPVCQSRCCAHGPAGAAAQSRRTVDSRTRKLMWKQHKADSERVAQAGKGPLTSTAECAASRPQKACQSTAAARHCCFKHLTRTEQLHTWLRVVEQ